MREDKRRMTERGVEKKGRVRKEGEGEGEEEMRIYIRE